MKVFIYTALQCQSTHEPLIGGHITTSFTEANRKLPKIYPSGLKTKGFIMGVEYWPEAKVTVALVSAAGLDELHQRLRNAGLDYPYEFKPHVTIAYGEDKTSEYQYLIGELIGISGDYIGTVIKSDEEEPYEHCQLSWGDRPERYSKVFGDVLQEKTNQAINALSQVEWDGTPSFYIGVSDVCTHRMSELDIPVWCKDADSALTAMNFISQFSFLKWGSQCLFLEIKDKQVLFEIEKRLTPNLSVQSEVQSLEILNLGASFDDNGIGVVTREKVDSLDDDFLDKHFPEGNKVRVTHLRAERSSKLKTLYFNKTKDPQVCRICDLDTVKRYPWADHVIELHHLLPLSSPVRVNRDTTSLRHLVGLCPSCHRATHKFYSNWFKAHKVKDFSSYEQALDVYSDIKQQIVLNF